MRLVSPQITWPAVQDPSPSGDALRPDPGRRRVVIRIVIVLGLLLILGVFVLDMSGAAARQSGSDRVRPLIFSVVVPGGGTVCQSIEGLPPDTARAEMLIGTYYRPLPPLRLRFFAASGAMVAQGSVSGGRQGYVAIPIRRISRLAVDQLCLHVGGRFRVAVGGNNAPAGPGSAYLNGKPEVAQVTVFYLRPGRETWWQMLPVLDQRFGLGKAPFFGRWTLPLVAVVVLLLWVGSIRLLLRELT